MAKQPKPLSATRVKSIREPGRYGDGGRGSWGLYVRVYRRSNGRLSKTWGQRIRIAGRPTNLGLGQWPLVTLAEARAKALANRREVEQGRDPRGGGIPTFEQAARRVLRLHAHSWKNPDRMAGQWRQTFRDYAAAFGSKPVSEVASGDILEALMPIWASKPAAAKMALQRIGAVLKWALARGYRKDNPAEAASAALPRSGKRTRHHRAVPHREAAAALARVRASKRELAAKLAFEFLSLTASRSVEVREARWSEVDLKARVWRIPAARMKAKRAHRIPLADRALSVLREARKLGSGVYCFPSFKTGGPLSTKSLWGLAQLTGGTVHGWRTSFRSWCGDTAVAREVAEAALAHVVSGVEGAYYRTRLFERRRQVMDDWSAYLAGGS